MILLDTNVISALMLRAPEPQVLAWLDSQSLSSIWTTAITEMEIRYGIETLAAGRRRDELSHSFEKLLHDVLEERVAHFDSAASRHAAALMAARKHLGQAIEIRDTMIAGIALALDATVATRNTSHFAHARLRIVDPWQA